MSGLSGKFKRMFVLALVIGLLLTVAQGPPPMESMCEFVVWIMTTAGTNFVVGVIISALVEYWPYWADMKPKPKRLVFLGLCLVVPVIGLGLGYLWCGMTLTLDSLFLVLKAGISAFTGGTVAHTRKLPSE